jgi:hypothetical protein
MKQKLKGKVRVRFLEEKELDRETARRIQRALR